MSLIQPLLLILFTVLSVVLVEVILRARHTRAGRIAIAFVVLALLATLVYAVWYAVWVIVSPPGFESTETQKHGDQPPVPRVNDLVGRLRLAWDSEAEANWPVAEDLARCCQLAYLAPVDAQDEFHKGGFQSIEPFFAGSMAGFVVSVDDAAVIVFRGTDDELDWFANLDDHKTSTPHGQIHSGFWKSYRSLEPQITKLIDRRKPKHVWITGHSLGGALAVACAYDRLVKGQAFDGVMTFGQPMLASPDLASYLNGALRGRFAHFVYQQDGVPKVPPGFKHSRSIVWFKEDGIHRSLPYKVMLAAPGKVVTSPSPEEDIVPLSEEEFRAEKAMVKARDESIRGPSGDHVYAMAFRPLDDHAIELYVDRVKKMIGGELRQIPPDGQRGAP